MSLINEALKKAQTDRPGSSIPDVPMEPGDRPPPPPPRKKRYLFGFIISVLVVGLLSALVSTYLVFQLLGEDDAPEQPVSETATETSLPPGDPQTPGEATQPQVVQEETTGQPVDPSMVGEPAEADSPGDPAVETTQTAPESQGEDPQPVAEELVINVPEAVESGQTPDLEPAPVEQASEPVQSEDQSIATAEPPAPEPDPEPEQVTNYAAANLDTQIWRRLDDFEIRGIMSGGAKVLIYDARTQKARTYTSGALIDGALALRIAKITSGEIQFTNNEGTIFTKVF